MTYAPLDVPGASRRGHRLGHGSAASLPPRYPATIRCRQRPLWGLLPLGHTTRTRKTSPSARPWLYSLWPDLSRLLRPSARGNPYPSCWSLTIIGNLGSRCADKGMAAWYFHHIKRQLARPGHGRRHDNSGGSSCGFSHRIRGGTAPAFLVTCHELTATDPSSRGWHPYHLFPACIQPRGEWHIPNLQDAQRYVDN